MTTTNRLRAKKDEINIDENPTKLPEGIGFFTDKETACPTYDDLQQRIRTRAYELWEEDGCPAGDGSDYWLKAEKELFERNEDGSYRIFVCDLQQNDNKGTYRHFVPTIIKPSEQTEATEQSEESQEAQVAAAS